ncbi:MULTISPECIES: response regulator transcription factor [Pseudomonas]|uniref:DNA-binding response regulator n=1 Tax=Pseudomonas protegens TaxID=380021 RepID=A0A2T6GGT9_9PSED|nr:MULTISPECIES: response regulator transcription factor [Pseudomonas]PUA43380.1 DNA-binding response regulator [Pseudomonas protegens]RXU68067.1 DNA-binding response regulator [Pseudomonas protegens]ULT73115.1 response regulator transcription factor [Pseudomonas sp. BC42]BAQ75536.1 DNA-binding response regulator, LuxR family [Pseudomonas sp. Os17]BAQ81692.1 DNA-binding response regulator, LuxR family [Pseudomonas sp. St29]
MTRTVLIVDDHPIICGAIRVTLEQHGYQVVAESTDGLDALAKIRSLAPEYLLLDIGLDSLDGLSVLQRIHSENLKIKTLVFTSQLASTYAARCMQAGALGFINKSANMDELVKGLNTINDGYLYFPKEVLAHYMEHGQNNESASQRLTNKEIIVLQLLVQGLSNVAIGERLHLSNKTVSGHKINILRKLGVRTTIELASIAKEMNLL